MDDAPRRGVLHRFGEHLPITDATPMISLGEGDTPLVRSTQIERDIGCEALYFKLESCNPTGSFKDRGMVVAVAKAMEDGAKAIMCASTGNTSASAAAYAAPLRAGRATSSCRTGNIARGKLAQSAVLRRRDHRRRRQLRRRAAHRARDHGEAPDRARELGEPVPHRGPEDGGVRDRRRARRCARRAGAARRQRRQHHGVLEGLRRVPPHGADEPAAAHAGLPGGRRGAARAGRARRSSRRPSRRRSASATRRRGRRRSPRATSRAAASMP